MGSTYTRQSSYTDGDVIQASDTNNEFDQLVAAFNESTGHTHDGTAAEGGPITKLLGNTLTFGAATAGTDITITFDGETNDGVLKWMEDEDYFEFSDDILIASTEKLQFRDTAIYLNSSTDGQLDIVADTLVQVATAAFTVDASGDITLDAGGADVVLKDDGTQYGALTNTSGNLIIKSGTTTAMTFSGANVTFAGTVTIGSAEISEAELEILDGATVTTTELNIMDGDTSATSTTVADADRVVFNDAGTMKQVAVTDLAAYFDDEITAMPNLVTTAATTVGALNSGSITSGFGTIDTGSSTITTTGLISGGSLDIDDVLINGTTIGHTDDTDLITLADGVVTVAGELSVTTLDIGGTNVTSTATELNIVDGNTSATSTTVVDADRVVMNDNGTMVQVAVTDLAAYFDDEITAMPNLVTTAATTVGALDSGSITSGFGTIDTGSSNITTTGLISGGSLDIDDVVINGSTIGHTDDTDLITVASGIATVAGELSVTTLDIGGTNVTSTATELNLLDGVSGLVQADFTKLAAVDSTAAELNIVDGGTSATSTTVADADRVVMNDNGTMVQVAVTDLAAYFDDEITAMPNLVTTAATTVGALNSGSITSGFGTIDTGSSNITTTGVGSFGSLDISGDIDVDGTTNLDAVDVDGAVNFAADVTFADGADIITASAGTSNFRAGVNAGNSIASGGNYNVVVGDEAGTALTTGDNNVAVGYEALSTEDAHGNNVAVGYQALKTLNAGAEGYNVAVGALAGDALTTGVNNTAVGYEALSTEDGNGNSTAIGYRALKTQNAGAEAYNVAVGVDAGLDITTGVRNTLLGTFAGSNLSSGAYNVAIGYNSLGTENAHGFNTAVGYQALKFLDAGADAYNVALGYQAGLSVSTGVQNTLIGGLAGDAITTGSFNTALGYAALSLDDLGSQNVAVGYHTLVAQNFATATTSLNTAVGSSAGANVSTGVNNTLIGGLAGDALTDADNNVAVGLAALSTDDIGSETVAVGASALENQNSATAVITYNTAVGYGAGIAVTIGTGNTFVGHRAGDGTNDGNNNTAIGNAALSANCGDTNVAVGADALSVCTGSDNTALGFKAGSALSSANNCLILGHDAGLTGSPGGNLTSGNNDLVLGDENISGANIQVSFTVASDQRDKTDFTALDVGLDFVKALNPVTYKWDKRSNYGDKYAKDYDLNAQTPDGTHKEDWLDVGFKAQEVEALEEAAGYKIADKTNLTTTLSNDGKQYGMQYEKFVPILVKAIQELSAKNDALEARIATLEG